MSKDSKRLDERNGVPLSDLASEINDRFATKVVDWVFRNQVDSGRPAEFRWEPDDQRALERIFTDPRQPSLKQPMKDSKFKRFVMSIIRNGLNTADVEMFVRYQDKLPLRSLGLVYDRGDFEITGKQVRTKRKIRAGFYMLEVNLSPAQFSSQIVADCSVKYVSGSNGTSSVTTEDFPFRVKSGALCKRMLWLSADAELEINSNIDLGASAVRNLRLGRLTRNFFLSRLYKKLGMSFNVKKDSTMSDSQIKALWERYCAIFNPRSNPQERYQYFLSSGEALNIPSIEEQLRQLRRLSSDKS